MVSYVLNLSMPIIFEMLISTFMIIFDTMMIGNFGGNKAVTAVGISSEIIFTLIDIFIAVGITVGITALVAQSMGAKDLINAEKYASEGVAIGSIISIIIFVVVFTFSKEIAIIAGAKGDILETAACFQKFFSIAMLFNMISTQIKGVLRGYGNTFVPLKICALVSIIKILLDWMLIFGHVFPRLCIIGAAYASIISEGVGMLFLFKYIFINSKVKLRIKYILNFDREIISRLLKIAIPSTMEDAVFNFSRLLCTFMIMSRGSVSFAANQIANTIENVSIMPGVAFGMATTTLVGLSVGEKSLKKAHNYTKTCAIWSICIMSFFSFIFLFFSTILVKFFIKEQEAEVILLAAACLFIGALEQPFIAISHCFAGALKGAGKAKSPFVVSFLTSIFIRVPLIYYFIYINKYPITYVWWITVFQWFVDGILMYICYKKMV